MFETKFFIPSPSLSHLTRLSKGKDPKSSITVKQKSVCEKRLGERVNVGKVGRWGTWNQAARAIHSGSLRLIDESENEGKKLFSGGEEGMLGREPSYIARSRMG